jgi:hypothetical protein
MSERILLSTGEVTHNTVGHHRALRALARKPLRNSLACAGGVMCHATTDTCFIGWVFLNITQDDREKIEMTGEI